MAVRYIRRASEVASNWTGEAAGVGVDSDTNTLVYNPDGTKRYVANRSDSGNKVAATSSTLAVTAESHAGRTIVLDRAAGIAVTLPAATGSGDVYRFYVKTTFTGDATIKAANSSDYFVGTAVLFADAGDTVVGFATANTGTPATESDTLDMFDASNVTGGFKGAFAEFTDIATNIWGARYVSDAGGTEATPWKVTV